MHKLASRKFWVAVASGLTGVMMSLGALSAEQASEVVQAVSSIVGGVITVSSVVAYLIGQSKVDAAQTQNKS